MDFNSEQVNDTDVERKTTLEDDKVVIDSEVVQTVDAETFMEMFEEKVNKQRQLSRAVRDMNNQIEQLLDERTEDMHFMHAIDSDQPQAEVVDPEDQPEPELTREIKDWDDFKSELSNSVPFAAIETYVKLQQAKEQLDQQRQQKQDVEEDVLALSATAERVAEEYDSIELPNNYELVMEELESEEE